MKLKLEIEYDEENKTSVEKNFDWDWANTQFDAIFNELASALICCGISKQYVDENLDYMDNPKYEQHVYCTECFSGDSLLNHLYNSQGELPNICKNCYPYDPEDSKPLSIRKNYSKA
jgi:hypothetical protein